MEIDYIEFIESYKVMFAVVYGLIFIMSFFGNLLVIIVMVKEKKMRETSANCFIVTIAIVDLISGAFALPLATYWMMTTESIHTCIWMASVMLVMFTTTINLQTALSLDRYLAVCHPLTYFVHKGSGYKKRIIFACAFIGTSFGLWPALGWNSGIMKYGCYVMDVLSSSYSLFLTTWSLACTITIIVFHVLIYKSLKENRRHRGSLFASKRHIDPIHKKHSEEIDISKTVSLIVGSFIICWIPGTIKFLAISVTRNPYLLYDVFGTYYGIIYCVFAFTASCFNSAIDPLIYACRMKEVRSAIKNLLTFKSCRSPKTSAEVLNKK